MSIAIDGMWPLLHLLGRWLLKFTFFYKNEVYKNMSLIFGQKLRTSEEQAEAETWEFINKKENEKWNNQGGLGTFWKYLMHFRGVLSENFDFSG